ncbi:hypothetical protein BT63DRAFT_230221 [Microthyrium microscopicum]|uniref:Uncharacterized protein n=1 Tax=Microthyrium microscopicum TaxID=703497 RepID=A0A6A6UGV3_9PEZI|nr:hypothetical protein BT63DRAFT_230221 [Microthyrium microscopicum]
MPLGNSVTVINKGGKIVSNGKQLGALWNEAKAAYRSKKVELRTARNAEYEEKRARHMLKGVSLSDEHLPKRASSHAGSHRSHRSRHASNERRASHQHGPSDRPHHTKRPDMVDRGYTDSTYANDVVYAHPAQPPAFEAPERGLTRRNTSPARPTSSRSYDEHLAYGTLPPPLPMRPSETEHELKGQMSKLNQLLEEANCLQYTATSMIEHLQKNPEALAAVGLTLAEISQLTRRVAPSALLTMKTAFPAVIALLASPEFLIAGGVAVGVTVVMLGGYKIIKRIKANKALENADETTELRELEELSSIEQWRRGIAEAAATSEGTSVDGEFITPHASQRLLDEGVLQPEDFKPKVADRARSTRSGGHRRKSTGSVKSESTGRSGRRHSQHHSHHKTRSHTSMDGESKSGDNVKVGKRKTALSGIKMLFAGKTPPQPVPS